MMHIIAGTNRANSRTTVIAKLLQSLYAQLGSQTEIIDIGALGLSISGGHNFDKNLPEELRHAIDKINNSRGLVIVAPEYNGSYPGALKYFIDHWSYPKSFEYRPVCFVGLGGRFGGLRPVEHLQQVFGYRNSFQYPTRVFLMNIWDHLKDGQLTDPAYVEFLKQQASGFVKFVSALESAKIDANSVNAK